MTWDRDHKLGLAAGVCLLLGALALDQCTPRPAHAREGWEGRPLVCNPEEMDAREVSACRAWIGRVPRPDLRPTISACCGESDAYIADAWGEDADGNYVAIITQDYPAATGDDGEGGTTTIPAVPKGTRVVIPRDKVNPGTDGNPSGHGIVFMSTNKFVYCYFGLTLASLGGAQ